MSQTQTDRNNQLSISLQFDCLEKTSDLERSQLNVHSITPAYAANWLKPIEKVDKPGNSAVSSQNALTCELLAQAESDEFVWDSGSQTLVKHIKKAGNNAPHSIASSKDCEEVSSSDPVEILYPSNDPLPIRRQLQHQNKIDSQAKMGKIWNKRNGKIPIALVSSIVLLASSVGLNHKDQSLEIHSHKIAFAANIIHSAPIGLDVLPSELKHNLKSKLVTVKTGVNGKASPDLSLIIAKQTEQAGRFKRSIPFGYFGGQFGLDARSTIVTYNIVGVELPAVDSKASQKPPEPKQLSNLELLLPARKTVISTDRKPPVLHLARFTQTLIPELKPIVTGNANIDDEDTVSLPEFTGLENPNNRIALKSHLERDEQQAIYKFSGVTKPTASALKNYFQRRALKLNIDLAKPLNRSAQP